MPEQLDNAIKKKKAEWYLAAARLQPDELQAIIPMAFPTSYQLEGLPMIARFPIDEWERQGAPSFDAVSWYKLCMKISRQDPRNFSSVFQMCSDMLDSKL